MDLGKGMGISGYYRNGKVCQGWIYKSIVLLLGLGIMLWYCKFQSLANETVYVNCDVLRCRSSAEIKDGNIVKNFYYGQALEKVADVGQWTAILLNGKTYYVFSQYVTGENPSVTNAEVKKEAKIVAQENWSQGEVGLDLTWKYADHSKINSGKAVLYEASVQRKEITVCVNAGHGTKGGSSVKTLCHPDGTRKVTSGTTAAGAYEAVAVSGGMTFSDGTPESEVTLAMARILKDKLLEQGYDVLMIRDGEDVQLDNIARTVIANNAADCHIALHWDSTTSDKGAFYMSVPSDATYRAMEPVASNWQEHNRLGEALIAGLKNNETKIFSGGSMEMDLTQTSYSTIPSIDMELGDKKSDHSQSALSKLADGLVAGVNQYFAK